MKISVRKMAAGSLMAALCFLCTRFLIIYHTPWGGYIHLGDMMVILCALLPGGWTGVFAAAAGSALADVFLGAWVYAPVTFIIKGVMALVVWLITKNKNPLGPMTILAIVVAELIMVAGYFAFDALLFGAAEVGLLSVATNLLQALFGVVASYLLLIPLDKIGLLNKYQNL